MGHPDPPNGVLALRYYHQNRASMSKYFDICLQCLELSSIRRFVAQNNLTTA